MRIGALQLDNNAAKQIADELNFACRQINHVGWGNILLTSAGRAALDTFMSKCRQVRRLGGMAISTAERYISSGFRNAAQDDLNRAKLFVEGLPSKVRTRIDEFRTLTQQQQTDQVVDLVLTWIIFWAAAGGSDFEGGLPDTDLLLGIGHHRNPFSHTILLGLESEMELRFAVEVLGAIHSQLPTPHSRAWDSSYRFLQAHKDAPIRAIWAGIGVHFLKDAAIFSKATKPYTGLPMSMSMEAHQALFAANGAACQAAAFVRDK